MCEQIEVIKEHMKRYPLMTIQDVAKLLYQSVFGGGHMIANPQKSLDYIKQEYGEMIEAPLGLDVEPIGGGMCRMYLSCLNQGMRPEVLNHIFVESANHRCGTVEELEKTIDDFVTACKDGVFPYDLEKVSLFFEQWKGQGYPMLRHSQVYRENYHPAYRVVDIWYVNVYDTICNIQKHNGSRIIAIDGMCASGKTTLANLLHKNYPDANVFHVDDYFLQPFQRTPERLSQVGGNLDYERFKEEIIDHLDSPEGLRYRKFDCGTQTLGEYIWVDWSPLTFVEGTYSQHPYFGDYFHLGILLCVDAVTQEDRIRKRNGEKMLGRFQREWIPKETAYFEAFHKDLIQKG